jgi:hypothetical protein
MIANDQWLHLLRLMTHPGTNTDHTMSYSLCMTVRCDFTHLPNQLCLRQVVWSARFALQRQINEICECKTLQKTVWIF